MVEILQNKNSATRFQILVEIAASGPNLHQKRIAARLGISPQAVSNYINQLTAEELLNATGRSAYRISIQGVNWMLKMLRELRDYVPEAAKAITNITVCAAVAENNLRRGQSVGLRMKEGLLFATSAPEGGARGIAAGSARKGEDVGISNIEGLVEITRGKVTILEVPGIQEGGSRHADLGLLKTQVTGHQQIGAIGIEAVAALKRAGVEPRYLFGVAEAAVEQALCGLPFVIVCAADAIPGLIKKLQDNNLDYEIVNLAKRNMSSTRL